jgi:type II secretory pathway component PulF
MDPELKQKLEALEKQMAEVEKMTRRIYYFFLTAAIASVIAFVIPLILIFFEIPTFMSTYGQISNLGV